MSIIAIALIIALSSLCVFYFRKVPNSLLNEIEDSNVEEDDEVHFSIDWKFNLTKLAIQ